MPYLLNEKLTVMEAKRQDWRGNPFFNNRFQYLTRPYRPSWINMLRWLFRPNPQRREKRADTWLPPVVGGTKYWKSNRDFVVWLGHSTFLLQLGECRIITDPNFSNLPLTPRLVSPPYAVDALRGIQYILLSHDHRDHTDEDSIKAILAHNPVRKILTPLKLGEVIADWIGGTTIEEAAWYQEYDLPADAPSITFLPCRHWCRRGLFDFNRVLWGSFMIEHKGHKIYFGGDSSVDTHWEEIARLFPDITIAMLAIGAYSPDFVMRDVHTTPEEALQGFRDLQARYFLPMHYGTYDLSDEPVSEPYRRVQTATEAVGLRDRLLLPALNEPVYLDELSTLPA